MSFTVAIIGRPNVGKSTLFNRLVGRKLALVDDTPGVTRDRRQGEASLMGLPFRVIDTAGLEEAEAESLAGRMRAQTETAVDEADVIFFVIDARAGLTPSDRHFGSLLRRAGKPVVLIANKAEGKVAESGFFEAFELGLGEPVAISAEHNEGFADLHEALLDALTPQMRAALREDDEDEDETPKGDLAEGEEPEEDRSKPIKIAIVGRPNAGKSTLINRLLGEERLLTGPEAGITRDTITVPFTHRDRAIELFDTAGIRRRARVVEKLEKLSVADGLRAIKFAEVVILLLDATVPFERQDLHLADLVAKEGRALVIGLNKWDLVENGPAKRRELEEECERLLPQIRGVPLVPVSGATGRGLDRLMDAALEQRDIWNSRISTGQLNRWFEAALEAHPPPAVSGRRIKLRFLTQATARPPTFVTFCSRPEAVPDSYIRYLVNGLRETFALNGVPIRLMLRKKRNPFEKKS
jgi:GTP-binding protein